MTTSTKQTNAAVTRKAKADLAASNVTGCTVKVSHCQVTFWNCFTPDTRTALAAALVLEAAGWNVIFPTGNGTFFGFTPA